MIASLVILVLGFSWLKGKNIFSRDSIYTVVYDNSNGLQNGDAVLIDGLKVGKVLSIMLQKDQSGVDVTLSIEPEINIPADTKAVIGGDLLGEKYIQLQLGHAAELADEDHPLEGEVEVDIMNQIKRLSGKINIMISSVDTTINVLSSIFTENLKEDFAKSITGIKSTLESFNKSAAKFNDILVREEPRIESIISNVNSTTDYVSQSEEQVKKILQNLQSLTDTLNSVEWQQLATELDIAMENINGITEKINSGEGSLGMAVNNKELYIKLSETLATLDKVLTEFGADPEINVRLFGGRDKNK